MKTSLSRASAAAGVSAAVVARLCDGLMVDAPEVLNGAWLGVAVGLALSLPALWLLRDVRSRATYVGLLALLLMDAAAVMEGAAFSESFLAFTHVAPAVLMLPLALAAVRCAFLGGDAIGAAARVLLWALSALAAVVALCQLPCYHPAWIAPALGEGWPSVLRSGLRSAGWIASITGAAITLCDEPPRFSRVARTAAASAGAAAGLVLLRLMMAPSAGVSPLSRSVRLDALLTNGRAPLELQLPMIVMWFMAMLHALCFECAACAMLLKRLSPKLPDQACVFGTVTAMFALALAGPRAAALSTWRFPALLLLILFARFRKGGTAPCAG